MPTRRLFVVATLALVVSACSSAGRSTDRSGPRNQLTQAQLMETNTPTVFDAIRRLRPEWLRVRGTRSVSGSVGIVVYMDGVRAGGLERLQQMTPSTVVSVRYMSPTDATTRWGTGHPAGVIEVLTR